MKKEFFDIRDLCKRGARGRAEIDSAKEQKALGIARDLPGRIWEFSFVHNGKTYKSDVILQTPDWKPKKEDWVEFDRQPETVDDSFLYAYKIG